MKSKNVDKLLDTMKLLNVDEDLSPTHVDELREKLLQIIRKKKLGFLKVSAEMGIAHKTFLSFIHENKDFSIKTIWKVEDWMKKHEVD